MMRPNCTKKVTQLAKNSNHVQFWGILRGLFRCSVDFIVMFTVMVIADMIQLCSKAPRIAFHCQISMSMTTVSLWLTKCSQVQKCGVIRLKFLVTVIHPAMHWSMLLTDLSWYCNRYRAGRATENSLKVLAGHLLYLVQMGPSPSSDTYVCSTWPLTSPLCTTLWYNWATLGSAHAWVWQGFHLAHVDPCRLPVKSKGRAHCSTKRPA